MPESEREQCKAQVNLTEATKDPNQSSEEPKASYAQEGKPQSITSRDVIISDVDFSSLKTPRSSQSSICDDFVTKITSSQKMRHI